MRAKSTKGRETIAILDPANRQCDFAKSCCYTPLRPKSMRFWTIGANRNRANDVSSPDVIKSF
jgi:hypothetical protein